MRLEGLIAGAGFASGDRFVAGVWRRGPLGPMADVMWADANGRRTLLAPDQAVADFVGGIYEFDAIEVVPFQLGMCTPECLALSAGDLELELRAGPARRIFELRPRLLRRSTAWVRFEDAVMRPLVGRLVLRGAGGVRGFGRSPSGVKEWYCIDGYSAVVSGRATLGGHDLGELRPLDPPVDFGFSAFPRQPAIVRCAPVLEGAASYLPRA